MMLKESVKLTSYSPAEELRNETFIALALWECLKDNDIEAYMEILNSHVRARNISQTSKEGEIARSTVYNVLKHGNPTLKTLGRIVHSFTETEPSESIEETHSLV